MKKVLSLGLLAALFLAGCSKSAPETANPVPVPAVAPAVAPAPAASPATSAPLAELGCDMGTNGTLYLTYPAAWSKSVKHVRQKDLVFDAPFFTSPNTNDLNLLVELVMLGDNRATSTMLKNTLFTMGQQELTNTVEKSISIEEFKSERMTGCYFRITDKRWTTNAPPAGEFRNMTRGYASVGPMVLTFSLVSNDIDRDEPIALQVLKSARYEKK